MEHIKLKDVVEKLEDADKEDDNNNDDLDIDYNII